MNERPADMHMTDFILSQLTNSPFTYTEGDFTVNLDRKTVMHLKSLRQQRSDLLAALVRTEQKIEELIYDQ